MTRKTATAATETPSALRALVSEWKASNPEAETLTDELAKTAPSPDDRARAGKRSKRAKHEPGNPGGCPACPETDLPCQKDEPSPGEMAAAIEAVVSEAVAGGEKAAKPAKTPTERKAKPAKQTRTISPERARQIEAMEAAQEPVPAKRKPAAKPKTPKTKEEILAAQRTAWASRTPEQKAKTALYDAAFYLRRFEATIQGKASAEQKAKREHLGSRVTAAKAALLAIAVRRLGTAHP